MDVLGWEDDAFVSFVLQEKYRNVIFLLLIKINSMSHLSIASIYKRVRFIWNIFYKQYYSLNQKKKLSVSGSSAFLTSTKQMIFSL